MRKTFSSKNLASDFGSDGPQALAVAGVRALYGALIETDRRSVPISCGDVRGGADLADFYGIGGSGAKPAQLLFAVHTYYALLMKLLAARIGADCNAGIADPFAWVADAGSRAVEQLVRSMTARLDDYDLDTLSGRGDLLKKSYQQLFPKTVRHDLGEYYTPDWLAEHVLDELGTNGEAGARLLDPACGSGTFLVAAIRRIRRTCGGPDLCRRIVRSIAGFDVNPLAVMAARTNYSIAIRDLLPHGGDIEIPVYLRDALLTTAVEPFDFVAGNPPWVRWSYLPAQYRADTVHLWREYGLFTKKGIESRLGTAELDLSMLFTYVAADKFLKPGGRLGFVITKEVFKSKSAGEGFRRFEVPEKRLAMNPYRADDFSELKPFDAANKTACLFLVKGEKPQRRIPYFVWSRKRASDVPDAELSIAEACDELVSERQIAQPVGEVGSPWQNAAEGEAEALSRMAGASAYKARIGARVEPYGVYWVEIVDASNPAAPVVVNLPERGKSDIEKIAPRRVEATFLFPLLRGRDIGRWSASPKVWAFLVNRSTKRQDWVSEETMRRTAPLTFDYFNLFRGALLQRPNYKKFFQPGTPFYSMFNIGPYTFAPYRVCWPRMNRTINACVVSEMQTPLGVKQVIPADTATIVAFDSESEAHYFCAIANSSLFQRFVASFSAAGRGFGSSAILERVHVAAFDEADARHCRLRDLSIACHTAAQEGGQLQGMEREIDAVVASIYEEGKGRPPQAAVPGKPTKS